MGGWRGRSLLLGLLLLLSGALPPGAAQEETIAPPADSSVVPTVLLPVGPSDFPDLSVSSGVSGSPDVTSEAPGNEATTETERPPALPTESDPESNDHVTTALGDITGTNNEPLSDPNKMSVTDSHDIATTQPPPTTAPTSRAGSVTPDSATPTPSLLITLRTMAPTKTQLTDDSTLHTTASTLHTTASTFMLSTLMSTITSSLIINSTVRRVSTTAPHTTRAEGQQGPSVLEVGHKKDLPSSSSNTLFVMVVSIFTIMTVMVVVVVGFHRYRNRNSRNAFRRLQDLPMDDMMEDTPLYSY
ncbi:uncharacterized protein [Dendropsophus ebraccatus]|uniref:uncharacterized protein n=1 Tax=Dendropsophus ebraccatus TaxID=150705 RepID=UPI003831B6C0